MKKVLFLFLLLAGMTNVYGQKFAVKSNLLYDATATINLGVEVGLSKKWSLDLSGNYNGWMLGDEAQNLTTKVHYSPLPVSAKDNAKLLLQSVTYNGIPLSE